MIDAGITRLEIGSFVSPRAIPQMADIGGIVEQLRERNGTCLRLVLGTSFDCPYEGRIDLARLLDAVDASADLPSGQTASHLRQVPRERLS